MAVTYDGLRQYIRSNPAQNPNLIRAKLRDISDWFSAGTVPPSWDAEDAVPLWINPQVINWAVESVWGATSGHLSTEENLQWGYRRRQPIEIPDILIWTDDRNSDVTKYLDTLEKFTKPGDTSYPPILAFVWGARVIQPIVLTSLSISETSWANGLVSAATVSMSFQFSKAPKYRSNADARRLESLSAREQVKIQKDAEDKLGLVKDAQGKLKVGLPTSKVPNLDQNQPITVNEKGEVLQGTVVVAKYSKKDANGSFARDSFELVKTKAAVRS
jgi:hypothetical protein